MGYNTGVLILNDAIGGLQEKDVATRWTEQLVAATSEVCIRGGRADVRIGNHLNGSTVFHCAHADNTGVYAIGGNYANRLGSFYGRNTDAEKIVRELADQLGFRLVRKTQKK